MTGGAELPLNLADQLALFKRWRGGGQIMPDTLLPAPRIQKAIYTSVGNAASVETRQKLNLMTIL